MATPARKRAKARRRSSPERVRTRVVVSPRPGEPAPVADPDVHGDRGALGLMATGPDLPAPPHFPSAAEIDPAPDDPGACPTCGRPLPNAVNTFATCGANPALAVPAREPDPEEAA
jgi:hypothetical protein